MIVKKMVLRAPFVHDGLQAVCQRGKEQADQREGVKDVKGGENQYLGRGVGCGGDGPGSYVKHIECLIVRPDPATLPPVVSRVR